VAVDRDYSRLLNRPGFVLSGPPGRAKLECGGAKVMGNLNHNAPPGTPLPNAPNFGLHLLASTV